MVKQSSNFVLISCILALSFGTGLSGSVALSNDNIWTIVVIRPFHDNGGNAHQLKQVSAYFNSQEQCEDFLVNTLAAPNRKATHKSITDKKHILEYRQNGDFASLVLEWQCLEIYRR